MAFCHVRDENSAELHHAPVEFNSCLVSLKDGASRLDVSTPHPLRDVVMEHDGIRV